MILTCGGYCHRFLVNISKRIYSETSTAHTMFGVGDHGRSGRTATVIFHFLALRCTGLVMTYFGVLRGRFGRHRRPILRIKGLPAAGAFPASGRRSLPARLRRIAISVRFRAAFASGKTMTLTTFRQTPAKCVCVAPTPHNITWNTGVPCRIASTYNRKRTPSRNWWRSVCPVCCKLRSPREPNLYGPR